MTFEEIWSEQPPLEYKNDLLQDNIHILKWCYEKGQQDVMDSQKELQEENERLEKEPINLKETIHFLQTQSELHTKQYKKEMQELIEAHEKDRELLLKYIDKYKEDLKKLRVAFIQVQVEHLLGKPITEIGETILGGE